MRFRKSYVFVLLPVICSWFISCRDNEPTGPVEPVLLAYDTIEYRYQQIADMAINLMANISMDPNIRVKQVQDLLDREPVVSIDFRKTEATSNDIIGFIRYQDKIDAGVADIFRQLDNAPKWKAAPLILEIKNRYKELNDSVQIAIRQFNAASLSAAVPLNIPIDSAGVKAD